MPVPIRPAPTTAARWGNGPGRDCACDCIVETEVTLPTLIRLLTRLARLRQLVPQLPSYERARGGPVIAQAVVLRGAEVLLLLRTSPRAWELPGGSVEPGELPAQAVVREVEEETGLEVRVSRLLGWYRRTGFRPHRSPVFVCQHVSGVARPNWESIRVSWFPLDQLPAGLFPWYRPVIADAASGRSHQDEQRQHLGLAAVWAAAMIHLRQVVLSTR